MKKLRSLPSFHTVIHNSVYIFVGWWQNIPNVLVQVFC